VRPARLVEDDAPPRPGRPWSWAALIAAILLWALGAPTFGFSVLLAPIGAVLVVIAWRRSPHDALFWIGFGLNAVLVLALVALVVGALTA
jgi:hypothetical protein